MLKPTTILVALMISAAPCMAEDPDIAITVCEAALKARLKAPSSYRKIEASISGNSVFLTYDAVNSYNAPLRAMKACKFNYKNMHFTLGIQTSSLEYERRIQMAEKAMKSKYGAFDAERHLNAAKEEMASWVADFEEGVAAAKAVNGYPIHISQTKLMPGE